MTTMEANQTRFAALGYRNFRSIWWGLIVSNMGTWMQNVANGWLVLQLIGLPSLGALGIGAFAEWLGGVKGAPHAVLIGAVILGIILLFVIPMFWKRDLSQRRI